MNEFFHKLLAEYIVKVHNAGHKNLTPVQIHKGYTNAFDFSVFDGLNEAINDFKSKGWITVSMKTSETVKGIKIVTEYIPIIAQEYGLITRESYIQDVNAILGTYSNHSNVQIRDFVSQQYELLNSGKLAIFTKIGQTTRLIEALKAAHTLDAQQDDTTLRELSIRVFNDSKKLESCISDALSILNEAEENIDAALKAHHVSRNPVYATIKGKAVLRFDNGETLNLGHFGGSLQLSREFVDKIVEINADCALTIENLTSFEQKTHNDRLYIYTGGYANNLVVALLQKLSCPISHFGDMDANGFKILYNLSTRTGKQITPYKMDIKTAKSNVRYGKTMSEFNQKELTRMLTNNQCSDDDKILFDFLLKQNVTFEQEIIPID